MTHKSATCDICKLATYEEFRHACVHASMDLNKAFEKKYHRDARPKWNYEMEDATLLFSGGALPDILCDMEVVGSTEEKTWEWSFANPNLPAACRSRMCVVYELGKERGWDRLNTTFLEDDEYVGWECAAIACHLLGGISVYRGPNSNSTREDALVDAVYMVIIAVRP